MFNLLLAAVSAFTLSIPVVHEAPPIDGSTNHSAWRNASVVSLDWDLQGHKRAPQTTRALIERDGDYLYVAFDAQQHDRVVATQHTDDEGEGSDDEVEIDLRPGGTNGFLYRFISNPIGTHYQSSSENLGYRPQWWSAGTVHDGGYVVTMKIPLSAMHGMNARVVLLQLIRRVAGSGDLDVWSYDPNEVSPTSATYAGSATGLQQRQRPQPRIELYTLGLAGGASAGGSTSRAGLDLSIPLTATSSFYATIHPDYSNVESDQQSISPTAFRRSVSEVRPFFAQGTAAYENFDFNISNGISTLYTPSIPTPRDGYAVEGNQSGFTYGAFDAIGDARTDSAQALTWRNARRTLGISVQRVAVNLSGFSDDSLEVGSSFNDGKRLTGYINYGSDSGTNVPDGRRAQYYDFGSAYSTSDTAFGFAVRKVGAYFNPADGYVWHPDIAGYGAFAKHVWLFGKDATFKSVTLQGEVQRYHDQTGELNDTLQGVLADFLTGRNVDITLQTGSAYVRFAPQGVFYPVSQNGVSVTFGSGADSSNVNNADHGASETPTTLAFNTGRFGSGRLNAWRFSSTMRAMRRGLISFEVDGNVQMLDTGTRYAQWLERASYTYQADRDTSFAFGVRRIIGTSPILGGAPEFRQGWNLSAAFHRTYGGANEIYAVYGDAGAFATTHAFIVKWIHYIGAGKGT